LIAHATTGDKRSPSLPEVPTVTELGLPQLTASVWFGLSAPKGVPAAIVQRLTLAHQQMLDSPEFKTRMAASGLNPSPDICGSTFLEKMNRETDRWARVVKATGFSALD
jgi:tripartite-type tricarboxylate transporter receptor subunit TctC